MVSSLIYSMLLLIVFFLLSGSGNGITPAKEPTSWKKKHQGHQFAKGRIELGGLEIREISTLANASFDDVTLPSGFFHLGSRSHSALLTLTLIAREASHSNSSPALSPPTDFLPIESSFGTTFLWLPVPLPGFLPAGLLRSASTSKPLLSSLRCVRQEFFQSCDNTGNSPALLCFKNIVDDAMPNLDQITKLLQKYSPWVHFHPDERYLPSSVSWFFNNGALLFSKTDPNGPTPVDPAGRALPQGGTNDGAYWLDLPSDDAEKDRVKAGELSTAEAYVHVKPALGGTATDIVFWLFYPFNGPGRAKVGLINIGLGHIGEHVGDWEHVTLRISNFDGVLKRMYFSQHTSGTWVEATDLVYSTPGQRPAAYATLNGHAFYPKAGLVLQGEVEKGIGIRDDTAEGGQTMNLTARAVIAAAEYLGDGAVAEPAWLQYMRDWGPKVSYDVSKEVDKLVRFLPGKMKRKVRNLVERLPPELFGQEGPTGPKVKASWDGDEV
ncbi:hypothetical protein HPP92_001608 [Vanilla planifolia]|uniref:Vacuolar protein sorting-associated protein 62 n=1 Tax=Vanilla planifolia TaxID=51239 RepID=A0A835S3P3_VANPL|nr:hypothetical protein HPP92_001608 [Vanilla planifolia]